MVVYSGLIFPNHVFKTLPIQPMELLFHQNLAAIKFWVLLLQPGNFKNMAFYCSWPVDKCRIVYQVYPHNHFPASASPLYIILDHMSASVFPFHCTWACLLDYEESKEMELFLCFTWTFEIKVYVGPIIIWENPFLKMEEIHSPGLLPHSNLTPLKSTNLLVPWSQLLHCYTPSQATC